MYCWGDDHKTLQASKPNKTNINQQPSTMRHAIFPGPGRSPDSHTSLPALGSGRQVPGGGWGFVASRAGFLQFRVTDQKICVFVGVLLAVEDFAACLRA